MSGHVFLHCYCKIILRQAPKEFLWKMGVAAPRSGNGCGAGRPWRPQEAHGKPLRNTVFCTGDYNGKRVRPPKRIIVKKKLSLTDQTVFFIPVGVHAVKKIGGKQKAQ